MSVGSGDAGKNGVFEGEVRVHLDQARVFDCGQEVHDQAQLSTVKIGCAEVDDCPYCEWDVCGFEDKRCGGMGGGGRLKSLQTGNDERGDTWRRVNFATEDSTVVGDEVNNE